MLRLSSYIKASQTFLVNKNVNNYYLTVDIVETKQQEISDKGVIGLLFLEIFKTRYLDKPH